MTDNEIKRVKDSLRICGTKNASCKGCIHEKERVFNCREKLTNSAIGTIEYEQERAEYYKAKCEELMFAKSTMTVGRLLPLIDGRIALHLGHGTRVISDNAMHLRGVLKSEVLDAEVCKIDFSSRGLGDDCSVILDLSTDEQGGDV